MHQTEEILTIVLPFLWLGLVLGISVIEAPLKFRAPGITIPLGLGIGRLVFRALNACELLLGVVLVLVIADIAPGWPLALIAALLALTAFQTFWLRRVLDRRALRLIAGEELPASHLHVVYIALEGVKLIALPILGAALAARWLP
jgi:hypothetical protein